jgi:hypothetical protein
MVDPGAVFNGIVAGTSNTPLVLAGTSAGTLSGLGTSITGFTHINEDAGAQWTLTGTLTNQATIALGSGGSLILKGTFATTLAFSAAAETLQPATAAQFTGAITGFGTGAAIELEGFKAHALSYSDGTLTLLSAKSQTLDTLKGTYDQADFALHDIGPHAPKSSTPATTQR